jgi:hypothetical protein
MRYDPLPPGSRHGSSLEENQNANFSWYSLERLGEQDHKSRNQESGKYIPIHQWNKFYCWPEVSILRRLVNRSRTNGFETVIRRSNGEVFVHDVDLFGWFKNIARML